MHKVKRKHMEVVFQLLAKPVGQAREAAHTHPHREVLALNVGRADQLLDRLTEDLLLF